MKEKCPKCGKRMKYRKPISEKDIDSWFCKKCVNLYKRKGDNFKLG